MTPAGWFWVGVTTGIAWAAGSVIVALLFGRMIHLADDSLHHLDDATIEDEHRALLEQEGGQP